MNGIMRYQAQLMQTMAAAVQEAAQRSAALARSLAPVGDGQDGGHLRDCIAWHVEVSDGYAQSEVTADNPHAAYVEMGTSRTAAQPYLRPALQLCKEGFLQSLSQP